MKCLTDVLPCWTLVFLTMIPCSLIDGYQCLKEHTASIFRAEVTSLSCVMYLCQTKFPIRSTAEIIFALCHCRFLHQSVGYYQFQVIYFFLMYLGPIRVAEVVTDSATSLFFSGHWAFDNIFVIVYAKCRLHFNDSDSMEQSPWRADMRWASQVFCEVRRFISVSTGVLRQSLFESSPHHRNSLS
jgi:hypothetical protein